MRSRHHERQAGVAHADDRVGAQAIGQQDGVVDRGIGGQDTLLQFRAQLLRLRMQALGHQFDIDDVRCQGGDVVQLPGQHLTADDTVPHGPLAHGVCSHQEPYTADAAASASPSRLFCSRSARAARSSMTLARREA